jgi:hypothetical protein
VPFRGTSKGTFCLGMIKVPQQNLDQGTLNDTLETSAHTLPIWYP